MQKRWMLVALLGLGLAGVGSSSVYAGEKDKDEQEVTVTMDQVPAAVKATIEKEAQGGKVGDIEKETKHGKTVYEADVTIGGKAYELKVAEDGKLLKKKLDDDKDEKGEH